MKKLLIPIAAITLLASCQPSDRGTTNTETLTQSKQSPDEGKAAKFTSRQESWASATRERFSPKSKAFANFLKGFPEASLPLALNNKTSRSIKSDGYINYDYVRFIPEIAEEHFSREVGKEYYYMARVGESKEYISVVYAVKNVMMGDNAPYGYVLASYNARGKRVDKLVAGGQIEMGDLLCNGRIGADGDVEVKEYKQQWANDPKEEGYFDNKIVGVSLKRTKHYQIMSNGAIQRLDEPSVAMR